MAVHVTTAENNKGDAVYSTNDFNADQTTGYLSIIKDGVTIAVWSPDTWVRVEVVE